MAKDGCLVGAIEGIPTEGVSLFTPIPKCASLEESSVGAMDPGRFAPHNPEGNLDSLLEDSLIVNGVRKFSAGVTDLGVGSREFRPSCLI